jgi:hypothetical protein
MPPDLQALSFQTGSIFTPGAPINEKDLFAGRSEQVEKIIDAVSQRGCHAILYGERGVGKTSLSNMISAFLANRLSFVISRTKLRHLGLVFVIMGQGAEGHRGVETSAPAWISYPASGPAHRPGL